jgi:hypothetical protein
LEIKASSIKGNREVLYMWNGVAVRNGNMIQSSIYSHCRDASRLGFSIICIGEAQLLDDGLMKLSSNMWSNSRRAIWSRSGVGLGRESCR